MPINQAQIFTVTQIARAVGKSRQAMRQCLAGIPESGARLVSGNVAAAWAIHTLPAKLQNELSFQAAAKGYRNSEALLNDPPKQWQPAVRLADVSQGQAAKAMKWRAALRNTWERRHSSEVSDSELARLGKTEFKEAFGYSISEKQWRTILNRTVQRDNGAENWDRLDIYLDDNLKSETDPNTQEVEEFEELEAMMNRWPDRRNPSNALKCAFWLRVFEVFEDKASDARQAKKLKRRLLNYLMDRAPFLASTETGLRTNFGKKYQRWIDGDRKAATVKDKRSEHSGWHRGPELTAEEWGKELDGFIFYTATVCAGRIAQGWREWIRERKAHPKVIQYYIANPASKSYVPQRYIEATRTDIRIIDAIHRSKKNFRANGAHLICTYEANFSNEAHCSDDVTLPVYYYVPDGQGWFTLMRGQFLVTIDCRSRRVLGFVLISARNYNSLAIHSLYTRVWSECGIPELVLHEGGIWDKSRLIKGRLIVDEHGTLPGDEIEFGLREFTKFRHAREARAKPVEGVIGRLQTWMEREPGYCGRDEIRDGYDQFKTIQKQIEAKKLSPEGVLHSADQWEARLFQIMEEYNAEPQDGKVLKGLSPNEAYERFQNFDNPPIKLPAQCRYLLAPRRPVKVGRNGITIAVGKNRYNYHSEATGRLIGETVLAWFNPECPEILTITDVKRKNAEAIARSAEVPAFNASPEILKEESRKVWAHQNYGLNRYRVLKAQFPQRFRRNVISPEMLQLGEEMQSKQEEVKQERQRTRKNARLASEIGVPLPLERAGLIETSEELKRFKTSLERAKEEAQEQGDL
jgi:hypothetical protein